MIHLAAQPTRTDPLTVFVHIPKTAGSSVNARLARDLGPGTKRVLHLVERPRLLALAAARACWLSGHVHLPRLDRALRAATAREIRYVTVVRDPVAKLASHYNWFIEVHRRGAATYLRYGRYHRAVSAEIRATDNADPHAVIAVLRRHRGLFLNHQARFLLGPDALDGAGDATLRTALGRFAIVGVAEDLGAFYARLGIDAPGSGTVNASPYGFDPAVFRSPELDAFLRRHNALDVRLYDLVAGTG